MRIPYLGLLALGGAQNQENRIIELEKQVIEQLEQGTFRIKFTHLLRLIISRNMV